MLNLVGFFRLIIGRRRLVATGLQFFSRAFSHFFAGSGLVAPLRPPPALFDEGSTLKALVAARELVVSEYAGEQAARAIALHHAKPESLAIHVGSRNRAGFEPITATHSAGRAPVETCRARAFHRYERESDIPYAPAIARITTEAAG